MADKWQDARLMAVERIVAAMAQRIGVDEATVRTWVNQVCASPTGHIGNANAVVEAIEKGRPR